MAFLDDNFDSPAAPPAYRSYEQPVRSILKALLPEDGTDIRGRMRSLSELRASSGLVEPEFDALLQILDSELRLVTPADALGTPQTGGELASEPSYQLTHDYLVPSIRRWLARKQKESLRGAPRSLWPSRRRSGRLIPNVATCRPSGSISACACSYPAPSGPGRRREYMGAAGRYHSVRCAIAAIAGVVLALGIREVLGQLEAASIRDRLLVASTAQVPGIIRELAPYRRWAVPMLKSATAKSPEDLSRRSRLHLSLALLPSDAAQIPVLFERMMAADPEEMLVIRDALLPQRAALTESLWAILTDPAAERERRFRAACALALYDPDDVRWSDVADDVVARLTAENPILIAGWMNTLLGAEAKLIPALRTAFDDRERSEQSRLCGRVRPFRVPEGRAREPGRARAASRAQPTRSPVAQIDPARRAGDPAVHRTNRRGEPAGLGGRKRQGRAGPRAAPMRPRRSWAWARATGSGRYLPRPPTRGCAPT